MNWWKAASEESDLERMTRITSDLARYGGPSIGEESYVELVMQNDDIPEEWLSIINTKILKYGYPPSWAEKWVRRKVEKGYMHPFWIEYIKKRIEEGKLNESFGQTWYHPWAKSIVNSGNIPDKWVEGINKSIVDSHMVPPWAKDFVLGKLFIGNYPPEWDKVIDEELKRNYKEPFMAPLWAHEWYIHKLIGNDAPDDWWYLFGRYYRRGTVGAYNKMLNNIFIDKVKDPRTPVIFIRGIMDRISDEGFAYWDLPESPEARKVLWEHPLRKKYSNANRYLYYRRLDDVITKYVNSDVKK